HVDMYRYAPTWWLLREARSQPSSNRAFWELERRWQDKTLSDAHIGQLAHVILSLQTARPPPSAPARSQSMHWCLLMEQAHNKGYLTKEEWSCYWKNAIPLFIKVPVSVKEGEPLFVNVGCNMYFADASIGVSYRATRLYVGDIEC